MRRGPAAAIWALALSGPVVIGVSVVLADRLGAPPDSFAQGYLNAVLGALVPLLGALVLTRVGPHPVGVILLVSGLASALSVAVFGYAQYGLVEHPGALVGALAAAWVSSWIWALGFLPLMTLGLLYFPDGRLPAPRWWPVAIGSAVGIALLVVSSALRPGPLENQSVRDNPLALPLPGPVWAGLDLVGHVLVLVGIVAGVAGAVVRWRRADGVVRTQLGWLVLAVLLLAGAVMPPWPVPLGDALVVVTAPLVPLAVAGVVLRGGVDGHEVAVRRSLVLGALTAILLLAYAAVVSLVGLALHGLASPVAPLVATGVVAVAFAPVHARLRRSADRLFYGDSGEPYKVLSAVGRGVAAPGEPARRPVEEMVQIVAHSLRLPYVRLEVGRGGERPVVGEWGRPSGDQHVVPLQYRGDIVGSLTVSDRGPRDRLRRTDLRLVDDLARQLGVVAHATLLTVDLQRSRQELVTAREEERRRLRRDLHDGLGPALAGVALGLDGLARMAPAGTEVRGLAEGLAAEVRESLADVRHLVDGLRPAELDQLGLYPAIRRRASLLGERMPDLEVSVEAESSVPATAAAEVAVYRIVAEALTNVQRHSGARSCHVRIGGGTGIEVVVEDDGEGIGPAAGTGSGLATMRERARELGGDLVVEPVSPRGTRIRAWIPVPS